MTRVWTQGLAALALAAASLAGVRAQEEPLPSDLREETEVRLALVDVFVVDGKGRTVPDLGKDDFLVRVYGRYVSPATLDVDCPLGGIADPRGGEPDAPGATSARPTEPSRIVLVFDYQHMGLAAEVLDRAVEMIRDRVFEHDEIMVAVLGNGLRVLVPFTADPDRIVETLEAMREDRAFFAGNFSSLTSLGFFRGLEALMEIMESFEGRKHVVVFSGPLDNAFEYDPQFDRLASLATSTRTSLYPVDSRGMVIDPFGPGGPPPKLARLATATGGRVTFNTNDLGLAYARARRDLGCRYTLGFYDRDVRLDKTRRIHVKVARPGLRAHYPARWVFRSGAAKARSLRESARMAPEMFDSGDLRARFFAMEPGSKRRRQGLVVVSFRPAGGEQAQVEGVLRSRYGTVVHSFEERVAPADVDSDGGSVVLLEPLMLRPGDYYLSVVVSGASYERPLAVGLEVSVPGISVESPGSESAPASLAATPA